ncbi:phage tail assembly protein [Chitiniphilus eburneus]|uniref:phage tail assembly protein n=1 Tax=Chitiniphilus eburneus TaxID=2571148 RepID=UPI0035D11222
MTSTKTVTLDTPISRGDQSITQVTLRKPSSGSLRGIQLASLLQMDVDSLIRVLPRISDPTLTEHDVRALDPADLLQLATEIGAFLLPRSALPATD